MQKLDLSLDLPDAPYIRCVQGPTGVAVLQVPASVGDHIAPPQADRGRGSRSHGPSADAAPVRQQALPRVQPKMPLSQFVPDGISSLMAEDLRIRHKVRQSLQHLEQAQTLVVRPAATLSGDVVCHSLRLQGELSGSLEASGLVHVEREAVVNGVIQRAEMVIVEGTVAVPANAVAIRCNGLVVLGESARVVGHIQCRSVAIYQGACVVGTIQASA
jgi:cytoskeletal protein CcmA (bactofilin family)